MPNTFALFFQCFINVTVQSDFVKGNLFLSI